MRNIILRGPAPWAQLTAFLLCGLYAGTSSSWAQSEPKQEGSDKPPAADRVVQKEEVVHEQDYVVKSADGFELTGTFSRPRGKESPQHILIMIHGSGPHDRNEDLTAVSTEKNLFFLRLSRLFAEAGWAAMRYDKRSHTLRQRALQDPEYSKSAEFQRISKDPLGHFIQDAQAQLEYARATYPQAKVYLLGHSQGTFIGLQVAHAAAKDVAGVVLIGYQAFPLEVLAVEQIVYRPLAHFYRLDANRDGTLDLQELSVDEQIAKLIRVQLPVLDLDQDQQISQSEMMAGNASNLFARRMIPTEYTIREIGYPALPSILKDAPFPVLFLQGEWDNQTPSYGVKGIQILSRMIWQSKHLRFRYFPKVGHALGPRESYDDLKYRPFTEEVGQQIVREIQQLMTSTPSSPADKADAGTR